MEAITSVLNMPIVHAALWLIAAFIVAAIARSLARGLIKRTGIGERMDASDGSLDATANYFAKLVYFIVFLLFVPAIFNTLGAGNASEPILSLLNTIWGYVPNIVAATIIMIAGVLVARLARQLLIPLFDKINVNKLQERAGIKVDDGARLSVTLASIVYALIIIPVVIIALQALNIDAITIPATNMLDTVIGFIPNVVVGLIIVVVGVFVARLAGNIMGQLVATTGVDTKLNRAYDGKLGSANLSKIVNYIVQGIIIVFFTVEGLNILQLDVLSGIGSAIVGYLPNVLAAFIVFALAAFAAGLVGQNMRDGAFASYAPLAQAAIWVLAAFMVLSQLNIANNIVQWLFVIALAGIAVAFAVAFGMGGRDFASKVLGYWGDDIDRARAARKDGER